MPSTFASANLDPVPVPAEAPEPGALTAEALYAAISTAMGNVKIHHANEVRAAVDKFVSSRRFLTQPIRVAAASLYGTIVFATEGETENTEDVLEVIHRFLSERRSLAALLRDPHARITPDMAAALASIVEV